MHTRNATAAASQTVVVDGIPLHALTQQQTVTEVMAQLERGNGGLLLTANVDIMFRLQMPEHRDVLDGSTLICQAGPWYSGPTFCAVRTGVSTPAIPMHWRRGSPHTGLAGAAITPPVASR